MCATHCRKHLPIVSKVFSPKHFIPDSRNIGGQVQVEGRVTPSFIPRSLPCPLPSWPFPTPRDGHESGLLADSGQTTQPANCIMYPHFSECCAWSVSPPVGNTPKYSTFVQRSVTAIIVVTTSRCGLAWLVLWPWNVIKRLVFLCVRDPLCNAASQVQCLDWLQLW